MNPNPLSVLIISLHLCVIFDPMNGEKYEFVIGGLFPVHQRGEGGRTCGKLSKEKGIQRLEAMLYAIREINSNSSFELQLIPKIVDTCSSDSYALDEILNFLQPNCNGTGQRVTGVIGAANSPVSEAVASVFRLFKIPQISYASTSEKLDNLDKYPYFFRVVPSDKFQVQVIADLLKFLKWTYVSFVAAAGDYGENALDGLKNYLSNSNEEDVCFVEELIIPRNATKENYRGVIRKLRLHEKAKGVIVFLNEGKLRTLLTAQNEIGVKPRILWLGSDSWGAKVSPVEKLENVAEGAITILPQRQSVEAGFEEYFKSLEPNRHDGNPWFTEFWENQFECTFDHKTSSEKSRCTGDESLDDSVKQEGLVPMVMDSVKVMAFALKNMCKEDNLICQNWRHKPNGKRLMKHIKDTVTKNWIGNKIISFDDKRSIPINYTIYQYRKKKNTDEIEYEYVEIAEWNPITRLDIDAFKDHFEWPDSNGKSFCSKPCGPGEEMERNRSNDCCWRCRKCDSSQFLPDPKGHCMRCEEGYVPTDNQTTCRMLEAEYLGRYMSSSWALIPTIFAIFGIITTAVVGGIFYANRNTPIIMASGRELCYVILIGVVLCYFLTFIVVSKPTQATCGILRGSLGLGLCMCYSAIFTKTNRLSRIFNRTLRSAKRPRYITPKSQLIICLCLFSIQVILSVLWLLLDPPDIHYMFMTNPAAKVLMCRGTSQAVFLSLAYNILLVILCTLYAFKTRKIPENFNEAKYISFAMYASCIIWLAFIPIFFSSWNNYEVHSTIICMSVSLCGTVALLCIFFPKLYIVIFDPEKNVRYPTTSNSTTGVPRPVRYLRTNQVAKTLLTTSSPDTKIRKQVLPVETH